MSDLFNEKEITLDKLREFFHENDFSTLPVKDPSEYTEDELELYNRVLEHINSEWESIAKTLGLTHPQDCYSKDFPPELIRDRVQRIIADQVVKISGDDKVLGNIFEQFIIPNLVDIADDTVTYTDEIADKALHNTVNALMQTLDIKSLAQSAKEFSCDEDFNPKKALNYPKMDHYKKYYHTRAKVKVNSLDEFIENGNDAVGETNVEFTTDMRMLIKKLIAESSEQECEIISLLSAGYNQSNIAKRLGISQSTISRKIKKFKNFLSEHA